MGMDKFADVPSEVMRLKMAVDEMLPLRGFLICPKCSKMLTGSASKGRSQYYHYYHCNPICGFRHKAQAANEQMVKEIKKYVSPLPELKLFKEIIISVFKSKTNIQRTEAKQLSTQLEEANKRLSKTRNLLLAGDIEADDYRVIKSETEEKINRFEAKLAVSVKDTTDIEPLINTAISNISQLEILYTKGSVTQKRKIIGSMFPEKLTFDGFQYRTTRVNEAINLITLINKKLEVKKNGTNHLSSDLSHHVIPLGLFYEGLSSFF